MGHLRRKSIVIFQKWQFFSKFFGDYCTNVTKFLPINLIDTSVELVGEEPDVGCTLSHWGPWGQCYSTCGPGIQTRQRSITWDHPYIASAHSWLFSGKTN